MIGGGQLARMTHQAAIALGQTLRVLATAPDEPAAQVTPDVVIGAHTDLEALRRVAGGRGRADVRPRARADGSCSTTLVADGRERRAATGGADPRPGQAGDAAPARRSSARRCRASPRCSTSPTSTPSRRAIGGPIVVKTARGGYDGRGRHAGQATSPRPGRSAERYLADGVAVLVEERVDMRRELSALVARSPFGQGAAWPIVQTVQRDGICVEVIAPAPDLGPGPRQRRRAARAAAGRRARRGRRAGGRAVRDRRRRRCWSTSWRCVRTTPGTGRWTAPAPASSSSTCGRCWTTRSVSTAPIAPVTVMANVLGAPQAPAMSMDERLHHLFARHARGEGAPVRQGRAARPQDRARERPWRGRGSLDDEAYVADVRERAVRAAHWLSHGEWTDGWDAHA